MLSGTRGVFGDPKDPKEDLKDSKEPPKELSKEVPEESPENDTKHPKETSEQRKPDAHNLAGSLERGSESGDAGVEGCAGSVERGAGGVEGATGGVEDERKVAGDAMDLQSPPIETDDPQNPALVLRGIINDGGLSVVRSGTFDGHKVAVKCIRDQDPKGRCLKQIQSELAILERLHENPHPNVVYLIARVGHQLVLPLYACDLFEYLTKTRAIPEERGKTFFRQMADALHHCHHHGVSHGDIKLENFALDKYPHGRSIPVVILIDFGGSATKARSTGDMCISPQYAAPEVRQVWRSDAKLSLDAQFRADVWSLGVALFCILHKFVPYSTKRALDKLQNGDLGSEERWTVSNPASHLLKQMMAGNPAHRPAMKDVLRHAWLIKPNKKTWAEWGTSQISSYLFAGEKE
jgi:serine/threonine protein kinase